MKIKKFFKFVFIIFIIAVLIVSGFAGYVLWDNSRVVNTRYTYETDKVTSAFDGYKICLITDFHNGNNYEKVIKAVNNADPDIICVGGDLINMEDTDYLNAKKLLDGLTEITDVFYVYGNHESNCANPEKFEQMIAETDVKLINDKTEVIEKDGCRINIIGYGDDIYSDFTYHFSKQAKKRLGDLSHKFNNDELSVLIMHRPQYFDVVSQLPYDLVLSGHLHGGLINISKIRDKVLDEHFGTTEYCSGIYEKNGKKLIISTGIAREEKLYRIFNTPEIITVEVKCK